MISWILLFIIILLLFLAAICAAIETAIIATSAGNLRGNKNLSKEKINEVFKIIKIKNKVISTFLIINSVVITVATTLSTKFFINIYGEELGTILASLILAIAIIVFGDVFPKTIAVSNAEKITIKSINIVKFSLFLLNPIINILDIFVKFVCRIFSININNNKSGIDEVRGIIEHYHLEGQVVKSDRDMLEGVLDIKEIDLSDIMINRTRIYSVSLNQDIKDIIKEITNSSFTRIPVWDKDPMNFIGVINVKDLYEELNKLNYEYKNLEIKKLIKEPQFVLETVTAFSQLQAFKKNKNHIAFVIDEYGDIQGIITLEDIIEEIVGNIEDEHDIEQPNINKVDNNNYVILGITTVRDINRELDWDLPEKEAATFAGLILNELKRIPKQGETLFIDKKRITILKKRKNTIFSVRVELEVNN